MKIEVFRSPVSRQWHFRIVARNGRTVAQSEAYKARAGALRTAGLFQWKGQPMAIAEVAA